MFAAVVVAGHIFQHWVAADYESISECQICKAIASASVDPAPLLIPVISVETTAFPLPLLPSGETSFTLLRSRAPPIP